MMATSQLIQVLYDSDLNKFAVTGFLDVNHAMESPDELVMQFFSFHASPIENFSLLVI